MTDPHNARRRVPEVRHGIITALRARGHRQYYTDSTGALTLDGIHVEMEIRPADSGYRWTPTDRTFIQIGSLAWGRIWWATEPVEGWDYEFVAEQVEAFVGWRRMQLRREARERRTARKHTTPITIT